jgi:hypothetical protein
VQQLSLSVQFGAGEEDDLELGCLLSSALTACGLQGRLRSLRLELGNLRIFFSSWLGTLRELQHLYVSSECPLCISEPLQHLTALEEVGRGGASVVSQCSLPAPACRPAFAAAAACVPSAPARRPLAGP